MIKIEDQPICIKFENIYKTFEEVKALQGVSFDVHQGEVFGFIGPNGTGKTTTIKILVGLIRNYEGNVYLNGKKIKNEPTELYRNVGYLPQESGFQEWRTVKMALQTFGQLSGMDKMALDQKINEVLIQVGLTGVLDRKISNLSGGMKQKLRLAQALLHNPNILILDEPMTGLDPASRFQMKQIIRSLVKKKITILLSSHILSDVEDIATQIGIINQGKMIKIGTPEGLQEEFNVEKRIELKFTSESSKCIGLMDIQGVTRIENEKKFTYILHLDGNFDYNEVMHLILKHVIDQQCNILSIRALRPNLEQVYMKLVGGDQV